LFSILQGTPQTRLKNPFYIILSFRESYERFPPRDDIVALSESERHTHPESVVTAEGQHDGDTRGLLRKSSVGIPLRGDAPAGAFSFMSHPDAPGTLTLS
jgi:hypothetical protein